MSASYFDEYSDRLASHLAQACVSASFLGSGILSSGDIDGKWNELAPEYFGDAVKEFNSYPEFALACAGYLGIAVAHKWDEDWTAGSRSSYSDYQDARGFDYMDEFIMDGIVKADAEGRKRLDDAMKLCSSCALSYLRHEAVEPQSVTAYKLVLATMAVMFRIGAAVELYRLGYRMEKVCFS